MRLADGSAVAIDARETAPAAATRDMFTAPGVPERASQLGPLAVATPGLVAGLGARARALRHALARRARWRPAIWLAEEGFAVGPRHAAAVDVLAGDGARGALPGDRARSSSRPAARRSRAGFRLVQPRSRGARCAPGRERGARRASTAARSRSAIAAEVQRRGGLLTRERPRGLRAEAARAACAARTAGSRCSRSRRRPRAASRSSRC